MQSAYSRAMWGAFFRAWFAEDANYNQFMLVMILVIGNGLCVVGMAVSGGWLPGGKF